MATKDISDLQVVQTRAGYPAKGATMTAPQEAAMRLALAALTSTDALPYEDWMRTSGHPAIKALNAALAQQGQEPLRELTEPQVHGIAHRKATPDEQHDAV